MNINQNPIQYAGLNMENMDATFFLTGLMNEFMNRFQTVGDNFFEEISWKQCFVIICSRLYEQPPTLKELSELMGCSHQNVKQMLLKLERAGYVRLVSDTSDKRKQRIMVTELADQLTAKYDAPSELFMKLLFEHVSDEELKTTIQTIIKMDEQLKMIASQIKENGVEALIQL